MAIAPGMPPPSAAVTNRLNFEPSTGVLGDAIDSGSVGVRRALMVGLALPLGAGPGPAAGGILLMVFRWCCEVTLIDRRIVHVMDFERGVSSSLAAPAYGLAHHVINEAASVDDRPGQ